MELDADGLYMIVRTTGKKTWAVRWYIGGKVKQKNLGDYPAVSLAEARRMRDEMKARLRSGLPADEEAERTLFSKVAEEFLRLKIARLSSRYARTVAYRVEHYIVPALGDLPLSEITRRRVTGLLLDLSGKGIIETAHRVGELITQIMDFAAERGYIVEHRLSRLSRVIPAREREHFAHIVTPEGLGDLLREIYKLRPSSARAAVLVTAYTFPRVGELLAATWDEIDLDAALWKVPSAHTKRKREHLVPLPRQVVTIFRDLRNFTDTPSRRVRDESRRLVFSAPRSPANFDKPITEATMLKIVKTICRKATAHGNPIPVTTIHGFRHTASTFLHARGENSLWIEKQLAHLDPNRIREVYNSYEFLDERRAMLQRYADYLDELRGVKQHFVSVDWEDTATPDDIEAHNEAMREYAAGETVPHEMINWE